MAAKIVPVDDIAIAVITVLRIMAVCYSFHLNCPELGHESVVHQEVPFANQQRLCLGSPVTQSSSLTMTSGSK
jgi:hypothetical protein